MDGLFEMVPRRKWRRLAWRWDKNALGNDKNGGAGETGQRGLPFHGPMAGACAAAGATGHGERPWRRWCGVAPPRLHL